jgi:polyketide biosynthesis 3-hydroxy-3-methylglutaryl-CoA synthase-like enzyme PksG
MADYESILVNSAAVKFGTRNVTLNPDSAPGVRSAGSRARLYLRSIKEFHREYAWIS